MPYGCSYDFCAHHKLIPDNEVVLCSKCGKKKAFHKDCFEKHNAEKHNGKAIAKSLKEPYENQKSGGGCI